MNREEKLKLSAEAEYGHAFRQGLFAKLYEQSLWRFVHRVRPLKPMRERVKGGRDVIYGGLPVKSFEAFMEAGGPLAGAEITEYGWRWEMKFISSAVLSDLDHRLENLGQQAARWREWFLSGIAESGKA